MDDKELKRLQRIADELARQVDRLRPRLNRALPISLTVHAAVITIGAIPALREWWVNETAGPKSRQEMKKDRKEPIRGILEDIVGAG